MTNRIDHAEKLDRIMDQLADSVLDLSDEALLAEITESGVDPHEEAERVRLLLRRSLERRKPVNNVHWVNSNKGGLTR
jgi:hypothetical protein